MNGSTFRAGGVPIDAVEGGIEEIVAQEPPRLVEDDRLLLREVDVEFGGDVHGARFPLVERDRLDAPGVQVEDFLAVRGERHVGLRARGGGQLFGDRAIRRGLVERPRVEVLLSGGAGDEDRRLPVRTDERFADVEPRWDERQPLPDVVEDDLNGFLCARLRRTSLRRVRLRRVVARRCRR